MAEKNKEIREDYYISRKLRIKKGEMLKIVNKNVHIRARIECKGTLEFENCVIYYNESKRRNEINIDKDAVLKINNSIIKCRGCSKYEFIVGHIRTEIVITNSIFNDCSNCINVFCGRKIVIYNCEVNNCFKEFLYVVVDYDTKVIIEKNSFNSNGLSEFHKDEVKKYKKKHSINGYYIFFFIKINTGRKGKCILKENVFNEDKKSMNKIEKDMNAIIRIVNYLLTPSADIRNCIFEGISGAIHAFNYYDCAFKDCSGSIYTGYYYDEEKPSKINTGGEIKNCSFNKCTSVIKVKG